MNTNKKRLTLALVALLLPPFGFGAARYARMVESQGTVEVQLTASSEWMAAERNLVLPEGAWVRTATGGRAEIELDDGAVVLLAAESQVELADLTRLSTGQRITLIAVERGVVYLSGAPQGRDALSLVTAGAQATLRGLGRVRVEAGEKGSGIAVLAGAVRFASAAAELELRTGAFARVEAGNAARFFLDREIPPGESDRWAEERAAHARQRYGAADLDAAGRWVETAALGRVWRPNVEDEWRPFQAGKWRWYDGLGYTWISADAWGWLPYHYGRWTRLENLGWVWASGSGVFKPGDVYWLRNEEGGYIGWGPLGPGEEWPAADPGNRLPQEFLHANTTYATFEAGSVAIDPAGFARPEDPLKGTVFEAAPPSPVFLASRLEAVRPMVGAAGVGIAPVVETTAAVAPAARQPVAPAVVVMTQPAAPAPPPEREEVAVPVPIPVPVGMVLVSPSGKSSTGAAAPVANAGGRRQTGGRGTLSPPRRKNFRNAVEEGLYNAVVQDLEARKFAKALEDLEGWSQRFRETELAAERLYYYELAYNGLNRPAAVVNTAAALSESGASFEDDMQGLSAAYLAAANFLKLERPSRQQVTAAKGSARDLQSLADVCFTSERRPEAISEADWKKAREGLKSLAAQVLAWH